jgi:putative DNA primase/helicase
MPDDKRLSKLQREILYYMNEEIPCHGTRVKHTGPYKIRSRTSHVVKNSQVKNTEKVETPVRKLNSIKGKASSFATMAQKPKASKIHSENIPEELKTLQQWVCWIEVNGNGKKSKIPYSPNGGLPAKTTDPSTWGTFKEAAHAYRRKAFDGLGFVFTTEDPYTGVDLDKCRDPATGQIEPWATEVIEKLDSYAEISPSGTGIHIIVKNRDKLPHNRRDRFEVYSESRYFTMTGNVLGARDEISERTAQLKKVCREVFQDGELPKRTPVKKNADEHVIDVAIVERRKQDKTLDALMEGEWKSNYPSQSEADLALATKLAHILGNDPARIFSAIKKSGLYREKWDREDYSTRTIDRAIAAIKTRERLPAGKHFPLTDLGNAERLVHLYGETLRYSKEFKQWLHWTGQKWQVDDTMAIDRYATKTVRTIYGEAEKATDSNDRKEIAKWAQRSESASRVREMISLAKSREGVAVTPDILDTNGWLLNCRNGTVNLITGKLSKHRQEHFITKLVDIDYDAKATCPVWENFLKEIMNDDEDLIGFLKRAVGYSLTGSKSEECMFILYGEGANGKSTFLNALHMITGDYGMHTPTETLLKKKYEGIRNDIARLKGTRFVTTAEVEKGKQLDESLVKLLSSTDPVVVRFLHREYFQYVPEYKVFMATNHKPQITGTDEGIWRRIRLIPFNVTIPREEQDKDLHRRFLRERAGILRWAVEGCLDWKRKGLGEPPAVVKATEEYRTEMDILANFINDCCIEDRTAKARSKDLYAEYFHWCEENGEALLGKRNFGTRLKERDYEPTKVGGDRGWKGLTLKKQDE